VIGAGVALDLGASAPDTVLGFAILAGLGVAVPGWALLGRRGAPAQPSPDRKPLSVRDLVVSGGLEPSLVS
jgi:hypothetical protein